MRPETILLTRQAPLLLTLLLAGCGGQEAATACGDQGCPAGTVPVESASSASGTQVEGSVDPTTWRGGGAFRTFGEGECAFTCETIQPCPEGSWPVLTATCFTCAVVNQRGDVVQGACGGTSLSATPAEGSGGPCAVDADCPGGYACRLDECEENCVVDSDCKADFICNDRGACVLPECVHDADCGGAYACDDYDLMCIERCSTGSDCASGYTCSSLGECVLPECSTNADCPGKAWCYSGLCEGGCASSRGGGWLVSFLALMLVVVRLGRYGSTVPESTTGDCGM